MEKEPPTHSPSLTLISGKPQRDESDERMVELASKVCSILSERMLEKIEQLMAPVAELMAPVAELETIRRKDFLSEREVSVFFSIPPATLQTDRCRGAGPRYIKDGRKILYSMADLVSYYERRIIKTRG